MEGVPRIFNGAHVSLIVARIKARSALSSIFGGAPERGRSCHQDSKGRFLILWMREATFTPINPSLPKTVYVVPAAENVSGTYAKGGSVLE